MVEESLLDTGEPHTHHPRSLVSLLAGLFLASLFLGACATTSRLPAARTVYYFGKMTTTSPDGARPYGPPTPSLVKRTTDPAGRLITEAVLQNGSLYVTELRRIGDGRTFDATVSDSSFAGTVELDGPEWDWTSWRYDIAMADGSGRIEGAGRLTDGGIATEKYFVGPDGQRRARIVDDLRVITEEVYRSRYAEMSSQ